MESSRGGRRQEGGGRRRARDLLPPPASLLPVLVALLLYANALGNDFALDDRGVILRNPIVQSPDGMWRAFAHPYWPREAGDAGVYRPLAIASYSLDWMLSGGSARWFHAVNLLWFAAAAVLVWMFAARMLAPAGALAAALLFAAHPVHVEAVANVVGRAECMAAAFVLAALLAHRRASWSAAPLFLLALLSKEGAIAFVALAPAMDLALEPDPRAALRRRKRLYASYGVIVLAYAATLAAVFQDRQFTTIAPAFLGLTTAERLLTVATVIPEYPRLLLAPTHLSWDYSPQIIAPVSTLTVLGAAGIAVVGVYGVLLVRAWRRDRALAFALLWVPIAIGPVANVLVPTGIALAERTLFLASVGVSLALGWLVQRYGPARPTAVVAAAAVLFVMFAARTWTRTPVWHNNRTLAFSLLADHPESYRAHQAVARVYARMGRWVEAESAYRTSRRLFPRDATVYREAAVTALQLGRLAEARALVDSAIALHPGYREAQALRSELALKSGSEE